ncbi:hypothetical protein [Gordonia caeni]|uniref:Uncharacterized protein n=1 Tax=Gordonia caeni TaxID=1007097 RepID=A0ABP7NNC7_9ACTN
MTAHPKFIRAAAVAGAGALAVAGLGAIAPHASAASADSTWTDGNSRFTMTVSDATPAVGDTVTITTQFQRKWAVEFIYDVKVLVPSCLSYQGGSSYWQSSPVSKVDPHEATEPGDQAYVKVSAPNVTSWSVPGVGDSWGQARTVSMEFSVTPACATGQTQGTGMHYGGSLGSGTYSDKGPSITVSSSGNGGNGGNDGGAAGSLDFGSLGGAFS